MPDENNGRITLAKVSLQIQQLQISVDKLTRGFDLDHDRLILLEQLVVQLRRDLDAFQDLKDDLTKKGIAVLVTAIILVLALTEVLLPHFVNP